VKLLLLTLLSLLTLKASSFYANITPSLETNIYGKIKILDQKEVVYSDIDGVGFSELSDLAYSKKDKKLYMVSDKGRLFTFNAEFKDKIDYLEPLNGVKLKNKNGKKWKKYKRDSEGLTLDGNNRLLISFEGEAKIAWFHKNSKDFGRQIKKYKLPKSLTKSKNFRSKNKSLEALAWHKKYGILTASEWPLKKYHKKKQTIYSLGGKKWHFKSEPEDRSSVTAIEVMDDGNLLVLERSFTGYMNPFIITLKKVYLNKVVDGMCKTEILLKMNSHKGWSVDNFEGLVRVGKNRFAMISDDNNNFFQRTLLIYFEVLK
jgi:hypothetical protein